MKNIIPTSREHIIQKILLYDSNEPNLFRIKNDVLFDVRAQTRGKLASPLYMS